MARQTTEELHRLYERFEEIVYKTGDIERFDEVVAEDFRHHAPIPTSNGLDGLKEFIREFRRAFPDANSTTKVAVAEGDRIAVSYTARGTHEGDFMGIPATGREIAVDGISFYRFDHEGKVTDEWASPDLMGMMHQLGVAPGPDG